VWADPSDPAAVEGSLNGLLSDSFRERHPDVLSRIVEWRLGEDADRETFEAHCAAIEGFDLSDRLYELTTPTLVVHGTEDTVCPKPAAEGLAGGSRAGSFTHAVAGARHFVGVEASAAVNNDDSRRLARGARRRPVLGVIEIAGRPDTTAHRRR